MIRYCFLILVIANCVFANDYCYIAEPPQKIENKVEIINRVIGFQQPARSQYSLEKQFELQKQLDPTIAKFLSPNIEPVKMRKFSFNKSNIGDYTPKPQATKQIQYQQVQQDYTWITGASIVIKNNEVTKPIIVNNDCPACQVETIKGY